MPKKMHVLQEREYNKLEVVGSVRSGSTLHIVQLINIIISFFSKEIINNYQPDPQTKTPCDSKANIQTVHDYEV